LVNAPAAAVYGSRRNDCPPAEFSELIGTETSKRRELPDSFREILRSTRKIQHQNMLTDDWFEYSV
jgi:hypothetical protein